MVGQDHTVSEIVGTLVLRNKHGVRVLELGYFLNELIRIPTTVAWRLPAKEYAIIVKSKARHVNAGPNLKLALQLVGVNANQRNTICKHC